MPTRDEVLDDIDSYYEAGWKYYEFAKDHIWLAKQKLHVWTDHNVLTELIEGCYDLYISVSNLTTFITPIAGKGKLPYFLRNFTIAEAPDAGITMRMILDEMFTADNEELKEFIGLVDAYRQSLWNKPFDMEFWAATARGFEIWG
ncbi:unnamed protein product [marine sediment metagenome]|uniref:Uncharacterized protein n=1 Tax=marine sediment metagenome TaxID=412755 RepID=X1RXC4_9ZZZZ